jgi:glycopeptide antibiotics resistance protein
MRQRIGLFILYLIFLVIFTLSPLTFSLEPFREFLSMDAGERIHDLLVFKLYDVFGNVLLFIPFGVWMRFAFTRKDPHRSIPLRIPLLIGLSLSLIIEIAQLFLIRSTSVIDLMSNTCGALLGFLLYNPIFQLIHWLRERLSRPVRAIITGIAALPIILVFLIPVRQSNFSNWNPEYPIVFYNEASGDRPWEGEIRHCSLYNHAFSPEQIRQAYESKSQELNDFSPATFGVTLSVPSGAGDSPAISESLGPMIATPLMQTSRMTILMLLRTHRIDQSGPARIVTQSLDANRRNWTLGQSERNLVFRVRTPAAGRNGSRFQLTAFNCLTDTSWHHVTAVYNRGFFRIYLDGDPIPSTLNLSRDYLPAMFGLGSHRIAWLAFCFVVFIPFFFLLYVQILRLRILLAMVGLILLAFGIEFILYFLTNQPVRGVIPLAAFLIGLTGAGFIGFVRNS